MELFLAPAVALDMPEDRSIDSPNRDLWLGRQSALADFGRHALGSLDLGAILQEACMLVARGLNVPIAKIVEVQPDGEDLLLRAAVGISPDEAVIGETKVPGHRRSAAGYALQTGQPVICHVPTETRFDVSEIVRRAGVQVSANVLIRSESGVFGTLEVDSLEERTFTTDDVDFLRTYAHLLAAAVERQRSGSLVRKLAREREVLFGELQHRVRNDLQIVTALLMLEARQAESAETRTRLESVRTRIDSLRLLHDHLFTRGEVSRVDLAHYLHRLCNDRMRVHGLGPDDPVMLDLDLETVTVDHGQAVPIGLIANEFLTNSLKHAFPLGKGCIGVMLGVPQEGQMRLRLSDNGIGLRQRRQTSGTGMGMRLIDLFAQQLQAEAYWTSTPGTTLILDIPYEAPA